MPNFQNVPGGQTISNTTVTVRGGTLTVGLNLQDAAGRDLVVTNAGNDIAIIPGDTRGGVRLYTLRVGPSVLATKSSLSGTIMATDDLSKPPADQFNVEFRFAMANRGRGLKFNLMVIQDPAGGVNIGGPARKQYLSGWTTGWPGSGFEFLPMPRWRMTQTRGDESRARPRVPAHQGAPDIYPRHGPAVARTRTLSGSWPSHARKVTGRGFE